MNREKTCPRKNFARIYLLVLLAIAGCAEEKQSATEIQILANVSVANTESSLTAAQLEYAIDRLTSGQPLPITAELEQKVLDSLVTSRAMALLAEQVMSEDEHRELDLKVQAYREELLAKEYIQQYTEPQPVTNEMVVQYYQEHPEEFGGDTIKSFEFISSQGPLDDDQRKLLVTQLQQVAPEDDLAELAKRLQQKSLPVRHQKAEMRTALVEPPLRELVAATAPGARAPLHNRDSVVLLQVNAERVMPPRPLAEVGAEIRKKLSPIQFKQAVKALSDEVKNQVKIEYLDKRG